MAKAFRDQKKIPAPMDMESFARHRWLETQFERYGEYWEEELQRITRNQRFLWGVNYGQWPEEVVRRLISQGRKPPTYNLTLDKAETLLGSIMGAGFSTKFEPVNGKLDSLGIRAQDMMTSDKKQMEWDISECATFLDALCLVGYERMVISDKRHARGNISWERLDSVRVRRDPRWIGDDVDQLKSYFYSYMLTPSEIMEMCDENTSEILIELRRREEMDGVDYGHHLGISNYRDAYEKWGDRHQVIEFHHIKEKMEPWEYDRKNNCLFPDTGYELGSEGDRRVKIAYIQKMELGADDIVWDKRRRVTKYIESICPTLHREHYITHGKDRVQNGSVNLLPLGWRFQGMYQGLVDRLYDINISVNRGEMSMDSILTSSAKGAFLLDKALAGGDPERMRQIEDSWNDDAARIWVEEGSTSDLGPNGGMIELRRSNVQADHFRVVDRRYDLADKFSKVPAAQESRTENSGEPNSLFENKQLVASIGQWMYTEMIKRHAIKKASRWLAQAKLTYSGDQREFSSGSGETFRVNRMSYDQNGNMYVLDDIALLPEYLVTAYPNKNSPIAKLQSKSNANQLLQISQADPNNRLLSLCFMSVIVEKTDIDDEKGEIEKALKLLKRQAALQVAGSIIQAEAAIKQQMQQAQAMVDGAGAGAPAPESQQPPQQLDGPEAEQGVDQQYSQVQPVQEESEAGTPQQEIATTV